MTSHIWSCWGSQLGDKRSGPAGLQRVPCAVHCCWQPAGKPCTFTGEVCMEFGMKLQALSHRKKTRP